MSAFALPAARHNWPAHLAGRNRYLSFPVGIRRFPDTLSRPRDLRLLHLSFLSFPPTNVRTPSQQSPTLNNNLKSLAMSHYCWFKMRGYQKYDIIAPFLAPKVGRRVLVDEQTRSLFSAIHNFQHIIECLPEAEYSSKSVDEQRLCQERTPLISSIDFLPGEPSNILFTQSLGCLTPRKWIRVDKYFDSCSTLWQRLSNAIVFCMPVSTASLNLSQDQTIE